MPRNLSHDGMEKGCASVEAGSKTVICANDLFASCIQLLYGKQQNVLVVASPEFLPRATMEGEVPLQQISHSKKHLVAPSYGQHILHILFILVKFIKYNIDSSLPENF